MRTTKMIFQAAILTILLSACQDPAVDATSEPADNQAANPHRVLYSMLDTFNVGDNIYARSLLIEKDSLWVGTSSGVMEIGLKELSMKNTFTREHGLANEYVFGIGADEQGYKWFGTNGGVVSRYKDGEWKTFFPMHGLADYWVYSFVQQRSGPFWIGTWDGANSVDLDDLTFKTYVSELINEWVYGLAIDQQDRVWFGTEGGVSMFDGEQWQEWSHDDGLGAQNSQNLPPSDNTGLGTRSRHDLNIQMEGGESYNPSYVFSIVVDSENIVWAGTWGGGLARFDGTEWTNYTFADGLAGNVIYSLALDGNGGLWAGTNRGLSHFDGSNWVRYGPESGVPARDVYAVAVTPEGDVWAGYRGAVVRLGLGP